MSDKKIELPPRTLAFYQKRKKVTGCPDEEYLGWHEIEFAGSQELRADAWKAIAGRLAADLRDELQGRKRDSLKAFDALSKSEGKEKSGIDFRPLQAINYNVS